jgi:predicted ATPase/DNA-binding winged helix-turn-helix (wHTH) protein
VGTTYELGPFGLDPALGVLTKAGVPQPLGARAVAVLAVLVQRANEYVSKAAIIDAAWPGLVVTESNLAVQISAIRRVLSVVPGGENWIETLARRGYRFVGPVIEMTAPSPPKADRERSNLPEPLTSFVGRERELVEIKRLLPDTRLLTLVGAGGIGKTRLALQAVAEVVDAYRDGVRFVEFAAIAEAALVPSTVARILGVRETLGAGLVDSLCRHLKRQHVLLLLDNCEHVLSECAALALAILRAAPETIIVATSREPLQVPGERIYALAPLSLADPRAEAATIARSEAVQLFVERSQRQQRDFALTPARAAVVAELCIHLAGIPLAIELAAARVRALSVEQILARIGDRFGLLASGSATVRRQQTLRATLDWSFDLLAEEDRAVLRRIGVFAGGFTLDAAVAVAGNDALDEYAIVDVLGRLVARSLLNADTAEPRTRYQLLETTRAYALEKLAEAEDVGALKSRHAQFFCTLFERAPAERQSVAEAEWRIRYQPELDNVRGALDWAFGPDGDPAIGITLCASAGELWYVMGLWHEGQRWLETAVGRLGPETRDLEQALLWQWLGEMWSMEKPAQAVAAYERAIELYRCGGERSVPGVVFIWLGEELARMGRIEQAAAVLAEARSLLDHATPPRTWGEYFLALGIVKRESGDLAAAREDYERCLSLARSAEAESMIVSALIFLADLTWETGDLDTAASGFREAAELIRNKQRASKGKLGLCLTNLAGIHTERGELDEALADAREGLPLRKESGYTWGAMDHLALRAALAGETANAARIAGHADAAYAAKATPRQGNEARARSRVDALLRERLATDALERLLAEGAGLTEDEAVKLALQN